jgi:outer membrane immunogenic protein
MLTLVGRGLLVVSMGVCMVQAAKATDFVFPVPQQSQGPNWAGPYLQNHGAAAVAGVPWATPGASNGFSSAAPPAVSDSFGYNFQSGNFVFGLEGSLAAANFDGKFTAPSLAASTDAAWTPNMNWLGTVTGKIGYSFGQWLPYAKGGFVAADVGSPTQSGPLVGGFSQGTDVSGWTAGVGLEYQLTPKWSMGLEYLYTDLGGGPQSTLGTAPISGAPEVYSTALKTQSLLGRLNYKTGW